MYVSLVNAERVLVDLNMPGMNGIEFLDAYRQGALAGQQPTVIIMLTSSLHQRDVQRAQALGVVTNFLNKPLTRELVLAILTSHFPLALPAS